VTIQNPPAMGATAQRSATEVEPAAMVWPNPVRGDGTVFLLVDQLAEEGQRVSVDIHDAKGRMVFGKEFGVISSVFNHTLDVGHFAPGMYTISIVAGDQRFTERLIVK
jgi:hypothetical protein